MHIRKNHSPMNLFRQIEGRVAVPLVLWIMGVPAGLCIVLWFLFFRGP